MFSGCDGQQQSSAGGSGGVQTLFSSLPAPPAGLGFTTYCSRLWGAPFLPMIHRYPPLFPGPPEGTNTSKDRGKLCSSLLPYDKSHNRERNLYNELNYNFIQMRYFLGCLMTPHQLHKVCSAS
jgi:hypothetical protein